MTTLPGSTTPPSVSIVIVNWNGLHLLDDCLRSLRAQTFRSFEVVLVDNGSSDGSAEWVAEHFPEVRLLALPENEGFCGGNNAGIRVARGEFVALLNNDTEAEPDWLEQLHAYMMSDPQCAVCDSKVLYFDRRDTIWSAGGSYGRSGAAGFRSQGELDDGRFERPVEVVIAVACAALYRRAVFEEIGMLDEYLFAGYEDVDWALRARLRGYRVMNVPSARVYHKVSATHKVNSPLYVFRGQRNVTAVYLKNMPNPLLLRYLPYHLLYIVGSGVYFLRIGRIGPFLRAKWRIVRDLRRLLASRREVQTLVLPASTFATALEPEWLGAKFRKLIGLT